MPTASVRDVALRAGVSVGTVSNVLNRPDRVSPDAVDRVQRAIDELGYVRNDAARQLRAGRSSTIGLVVLDVSNPFFAEVARGAQEEAAGHGFTVVLGNSDENDAREDDYLDLFEKQRIHGVLISPNGDVEERLRRLRSRGTPAVLVDRRSEDASVSSVAVDDIAGGRLAVEHLVQAGRRRIAYVGGPLTIRQVTDRLEGARLAAAAGGAALEVVEVSSLSVLEGRRAGEHLAARPAGERPDAIFAANDLVAVGLLQALVMQRSLRVPEDVALVGYDDIDFASTAVVPLTSIRQPSRLIGETAVQILLEEAEDPGRPPQEVVFQPELIARASSAAR
ncbi:LacI family DNA-binding transcriptional regulator [Naasia sp. SYSU D00057]|uniref:LacI family DNA-binding transcriptional regulator n=1 Tax=Naasia sp. SYSU D00057 TaxID=2817380 RepID=UPI001B311BA4|nr:LacI family DNA-binding transcriptional regulator [Naasia sp. SYSU D00057]